MTRLSLVTFLLLLCTSACPIPIPYLCDDSMVLAIEDGDPARFSWGEEAVQSLWVHDGVGTTYWDLRCPEGTGSAWEADDACLTGPLDYGAVPEGAAQEAEATPLPEGLMLHVEVYRIELGTAEGCWVSNDFILPLPAAGASQ